jgi:hypothetical protein
VILQSANFYTHFSMLKSLEASFGLPCLNHAATTPRMSWRICSAAGRWSRADEVENRLDRGGRADFSFLVRTAPFFKLSDFLHIGVAPHQKIFCGNRRFKLRSSA